jgi:hypothetical protein
VRREAERFVATKSTKGTKANLVFLCLFVADHFRCANSHGSNSVSFTTLGHICRAEAAKPESSIRTTIVCSC